MAKTEIDKVKILTRRAIGTLWIFKTLSILIFSIIILPIEYNPRYEKNTSPKRFLAHFLTAKSKIKNTQISQIDSYKKVG